MAIKKLLICLFSFSISIFSPLFVTIITAEPPHSSLHHLNSKISTLGSSIEEINRELRSKDEGIRQMERIIQEKSNSIALLQSEIQFLQQKESLDVKEPKGSTHAQAGELEKQVERLKKEIETQNMIKDELEARANVAGKKIHELNLKLENFQKIGDEQKTRVHKAEHLLKVVEEEMLKAKLEAASISEELVKVHRGWVPRWLAVHLGYFQSYIVTHWNEHGRPALDLLIQKASENKGQVEKWAEPYIETMMTKWLPSMMEQRLTFVTSLEPHIHSLTAKTFEAYHASKSFVVPHVIKVQKMADPYIQGARKFTQPYFNQVMTVTEPYLDKVSVALKPHTKKIVQAYRKFIKSATLHHRQVQEMLRNNDFTRPLATMELAWFAATALLALPVIFLFKLYSAIFSKKTRKRSHTTHSHSKHRHRRPKRSHPEK